MSLGSKSLVHALSFHHTSLIKHKFNDTIIKNFKMVTMEH